MNKEIIKMETLGERIVNARNKKGYSQEKFAEQLGVSRQMVSRWELNTAVPRMSRMEKICELLDLTANELINGTESDESLNNQPDNSKETVANGYKALKFKTNMRRTALILFRIFIILLILYLAYTSFKFITLKHIIGEVSKYENLNNYYCKITSVDESETESVQEIWYKDGVYKIIDITKINETDVKTELIIDLNNKCRYQIDEDTKTAKKRNGLSDYSDYLNGSFLYTSLPTEISNKHNYISTAFKLNKVLYYKKDNFRCLELNNSVIHLDKNTYLPIVYKINQKDNKLKDSIYKNFEIQLDNVRNDDISIPSDYKIQ